MACSNFPSDKDEQWDHAEAGSPPNSVLPMLDLGLSGRGLERISIGLESLYRMLISIISVRVIDHPFLWRLASIVVFEPTEVLQSDRTRVKLTIKRLPPRQTGWTRWELREAYNCSDSSRIEFFSDRAGRILHAKYHYVGKRRLQLALTHRSKATRSLWSPADPAGVLEALWSFPIRALLLSSNLIAPKHFPKPISPDLPRPFLAL